MKVWHFKKGIQKAIEIITATSFTLLLGVAGVETKAGWFILAGLFITTFGGLFLLDKYGRY